MSVLGPILAQKRLDVEARKTNKPLESLLGRLVRSERDFTRALARPGLSLISEIKRRSPSKGLLRDPFDVAAIASVYDRSARAISVLCDQPFFGGNLTDLGLARKACSLPLLAKDFIVDPDYQVPEARYYGADAVLLIARVSSSEQINSAIGLAKSYGMAALVEVHDRAELERVLKETSAEIIGVNSRDLDTLTIDPERVFQLAPLIRAAGKILVAESGLEEKSAIDRLRPVADAVLIGTSLMRAPDISSALANLGFPPEEKKPEVKICGVRTREGAEACVAAGADYIGFNFVPASKRYVTPQNAAEIWRGLSGPQPVAVFVDPTADQLQEVFSVLGHDVIVQLHGTEPPAFVALLRRSHRVIKALAVTPELTLQQIFEYRDAGAELLFDAPKAGGGVIFDWTLLETVTTPYFLAGGLNPENVGAAVKHLRPGAVDTASGVEVGGQQDPARIAAFCRAARGDS